MHVLLCMLCLGVQVIWLNFCFGLLVVSDLTALVMPVVPDLIAVFLFGLASLWTSLFAPVRNAPCCMVGVVRIG